MLRRLENDDVNATLPVPIGTAASEAIVPVVPDGELETPLSPHDRPRWVRDALAVSQRARELIARLRPVAVRVLSFWDHRMRAVVIGECCVRVDASGCYRIDG
jgi:hypothetical protein